MNYIQYGTKANATEIETFLNHVLKNEAVLDKLYEVAVHTLVQKWQEA